MDRPSGDVRTTSGRSVIGRLNDPVTRGARSSVASSVPSVCSERSRLSDSRARSIARSMRDSETASAPSWRPRATVASCWAELRCCSAIAPPATAARSRTPAPTRRPRSRRFWRRWRSASSSEWRLLSVRNSRSRSFSSRCRPAAQSSVAVSRAPRYSSAGSRSAASQRFALSVRCSLSSRPCVSSASHPWNRGHSRSSASCATSTLDPSAVRSRSAVSRATTWRARGRGRGRAPTAALVAGRGHPRPRWSPVAGTAGGWPRAPRP